MRQWCGGLLGQLSGELRQQNDSAVIQVVYVDAAPATPIHSDRPAELPPAA